MSKRNWRAFPIAGVFAFCAFGGVLIYLNQAWNEIHVGAVNEATQIERKISVPRLDAKNTQLPKVSFWTIEKSDVAAQWTMAAGTIAIVVLTGFGLLVLRKTLRETEAASIHVRETLEEAKKTTKLTQETARDQSRAYIEVVKAEIFHNDYDWKTTQVILTINNSGKTPAKWFSVAGVSYVGKFGSIGRVFDRSRFTNLTPRRWHGLGAETKTTCLLDSENEVSNMITVKNNQLANIFVIAGSVQYETLYGEIFESEFWFTTRNLRGAIRNDKTGEVPIKMSKAVALEIRTYHKLRDA